MRPAIHIVGAEDGNETQTEHRVEQWIVIFVVLLINCFLYLTNSAAGGPSDPDTGSGLAQAVWFVVYAGAFIGLFVERGRAWSLLFKSWPIVLLVALVALSTFWSSDPKLTEKRAFGLLGTTAISYYVACRFSLWTFIKILGISTVIAAALSLIAVIAIPSLGIMHGDEYPGAWQGIYDHKNSLGEAMSLGIVTLLAIAVGTAGRRRLFAIGGIALCSVLLIGSQSATAVVSSFVGSGIVVLGLMWRSRRYVGIARVATVIIGLSVIAFALNWQALMGVLGRDTSFTGRTAIWPVALEAIQSHPLLGFGYGVFWLPDGAYVDYVAQTNWDFWSPGEAHNGFVQLSLDVGLVGAVLFVLTLLYATWRSISYIARSLDTSSVWPLAVITCFVIENMTEDTIATYNDLYWVIFVAAFLYTICKREPEPHLAANRSLLGPDRLHGPQRSF